MSGFDASPSAERSFEAIEQAVLETARGRWFLAEYARRNRTADTRALLEAIGRLEGAVTGRDMPGDVARLRDDLTEMSGAIQRMKTEISQLASPVGGSHHLLEASETLDGIVRTTEIATSAILDATEHIQEVAWSMRERGADAAACDALDLRATEIYSACEFQDLTAQRTAKVLQMLGFLEHRIAAMSLAWGAATDTGAKPAQKQSSELGLTQSDIDFVIVDGPPPEPPVDGPTPARSDAEASGLGDLDRLSTADKLRLFT